MKKKEFPPVHLKNVWLEHKNGLTCVPDLIDISVPWEIVNRILVLSYIVKKNNDVRCLLMHSSYNLFSISHDENENYTEIHVDHIEVMKDHVSFVIETPYTGEELSTMDIPIDGLLQGLHCLRIEDGKTVQPTEEDRDCFDRDEWRYVVAPTIEIAATKCTHNIQSEKSIPTLVNNIKELGEQLSPQD